MYLPKYSPVILLPLVFFTSCLGPKKMNKWIASEYGETVDINKNKSDYITVTSPLINDDPHASKGMQKTTAFLPLIFYWKVNYHVSETLNPRIPVNVFTTTFTNYANSKGLRQKLDGAKLELTINKIPVTFSLNQDDRVYYFILFYIHSEKIYLLPEARELSITYKLTRNNAVIKNGVLNIPDQNKIQKTRFLESMKKATSEYLSEYDDNIRAMAKSAVDKIITEL